MMKRCVSFILLSVCFLLVLSPIAHADVLIAPNNDFYTRHRSECTSLRRSFYVNGESGEVSVKKEPGSKNETFRINNGEIIHIMFTYDYKGEVWGITEIYSEGKSYNKWPNGWIPMNELLLVYDYISFSEDHRSVFYPYTGNFEALKSAEEIVVWTWPGSGETQGTLEALTEENYDNFSFSHAYQDEEGREWGFIDYWYGYRNVWVCISDPASKDMPALNPPPQPELWQPDGSNAPNSSLPIPLLAIILVFVLVVGTAVLIRVFWKPNKNET